MNFEEFMAMKKFYIQPQTDKMTFGQFSSVCATSTEFGQKQEGSSGNPVMGDAPMRKLSTLYI